MVSKIIFKFQKNLKPSMGRWQTNFRTLSPQDCQAYKLSDLVIKILLMTARSNLFWHQTQKKFTRYGDSTYFYFTCLCLFYIRQNRPKINDVLIVLKLPVHLGVSLTVRLSFKVLFQDHASLTPWLRGRKWVLTTIMELFGSVFETKKEILWNWKKVLSELRSVFSESSYHNSSNKIQIF